MTTQHTKITRYGISSLMVVAMLFTAVPTFAAKKNGKQQPQPLLQTILSVVTTSASAATTTDTRATTSTDTASTSNPSTTPEPTPVPTTIPDNASNPIIIFTPDPTPAPVTPTEESAATTTATTTVSEAPKDETPSGITSAIGAIGKALGSVKEKIFAKPADTATSTATTTGPIATTGIASLFAGPSLSGNVYNSNQFGESDTYKLLALALALAAAGLFLTNTEVFTRTYGSLSDAITIPTPQAQRRRA